MEAKYIIVTMVNSIKSDNNVWAVGYTGEERPEGFCKSPYKAMRFAFLLKKRTGIMIDDASLKSLSQQIAKQKADEAEGAAAQKVQEEVSKKIAEEHSVDAVLEEKPKKQRKSRKKSEPKVVSMTPEVPEDLIAFL